MAGRKGRSGRKAWVPSDDERLKIKHYAAVGIPVDEIAKVIGRCRRTIEKHCKEELKTGHIEANYAVLRSLFTKAMGNGPGAVGAAIFWAKARCGWKDTSVRELVGKDGAPLQSEVDPTDELARRLDRIAAALGTDEDDPDDESGGNNDGTG